MKKECNLSIPEQLVCSAFVVLILANFLGLIFGLMSSSLYTPCKGFDRPIKYLAPAFELGCWVMTPFTK